MESSSSLSMAASCVEAAVLAAVRAGAPRRTVAATAAAVASAAMADWRSSNSQPGSVAGPAAAKRRRKKRNNKRKKSEKTSLGGDGASASEVMDAQASVEERAEMAGEAGQEEAANAVTPGSTARGGALAAPEEEAAQEAMARNRSMEEVNEQVELFTALERELESNDQLTEAMCKLQSLCNLHQYPLVWDMFGFSSDHELRSAITLVQAACEAEQRSSTCHNQEDQSVCSVPPGAKGKGKSKNSKRRPRVTHIPTGPWSPD